MAELFDEKSISVGGQPLIAPKRSTRNDGWNSVLSGIGTNRDKRKSFRYKADTFFSVAELTPMYKDGLIRRIINTFPDDMTREWGYFARDPGAEVGIPGQIEQEMLRLRASYAFNKAKKWARLTGGALIYVGFMGSGSPDTPLNIESVTNIEFLRVFDLGDIMTYNSIYDYDPTSATFGQILLYQVVVRSGNEFSYMWLHRSRCIEIQGEEAPPSSIFGSVAETRYWGTSVIQGIYDDLRDFRGALSNTALILQEFIIGKYKFEDLDAMLMEGNEKAIQIRISAIEQSKSAINAVMLGTGEEYTRDAATVTGIPDLIDRFMMVLSSVTNYPVTKLFGRAAAGLNATGANDISMYDDSVKSEQILMTPAVQTLGDWICKWKKIDGYHPWIWNSLRQLTVDEQNEADRKKAETVRTLADADQRMLTEGVLLPEEVYKMRYESILGKKKFTDDMIPDVDTSKAAKGMDLNLMKKKPEQPIVTNEKEGMDE